MPEHFKPTSLQLSSALNLREDALRQLSRSPHPYFRHQSELSHGLEEFERNSHRPKANLHPIQTALDVGRSVPHTPLSAHFESTPSDSGTEADDEHFLKGLPAPKLRPHKGLRDGEGSLSGSTSPQPSPCGFEDESFKIGGYSRRISPQSALWNEEAVQKAAEKIRCKRRNEIVRRSVEVILLVFVGTIICLDPEVRHLAHLWRRSLSCEAIVVVSLIALYPLRLLRRSNPARPWTRPLPISIPSSFDPAPLLYPPSITLLVSILICKETPLALSPSIILGISSLPRLLIPTFGGPQGAYILHWFLSCLPLLVNNSSTTLPQITKFNNESLPPELLTLLYPLHQVTCTILHHLTATSLLPAELQLLSIALIELLLLGTSPQTQILKVLLWGGGIGLLISCSYVFRQGIALARVPKWRFRREEIPSKTGARNSRFSLNVISCGIFGTSPFARSPSVTDSSGDDSDDTNSYISTRRARKLGNGYAALGPNGSVSAVVPNSRANFFKETNGEKFFPFSRRSSMPSVANLPSRLPNRTPSGRRKRATSSSVQAFFPLTQTQATIWKWMYAFYVLFCMLIIILVGIREYVSRYALHDNEPIGWALGYLFGDLPWFRMEVVSRNLQRWVCLPPRNIFEEQASCHLGWVEHLRHATFGEANTRLLLSAYYLLVISTGLGVVFRLSEICEVDTRRKVFHFVMVGMLLPGTFVDPTFAALALSLMLAIFLLLDIFRASQLPPLSKAIANFLAPYVDGRDLKGPVVISHIFLLIGCAIPLWLSLGGLPRLGNDYLSGWEIPTREVSMVSGVICVGMGDSAASLIGRRYGRRKWLWGGGKSIEGSVAFATAVSLALVLAKLWLRLGGWPANNDDVWFMTVGKAGVAAWVASLTEAVLTGGNDNVVVPVVLWLCVKGLDI